MTSTLDRFHLYVDGAWADPLGSDVIEVISPHTEEVIARVPHASAQDVDRAVAAARKAFDEGPWPRTPVAERARVLRAIADQLEARGPEVAALVTAQNGCPSATAVAVQVAGAVNSYRAAADNAEKFEFEEHLDGARGPVLVLHEPVGTVAVIVPWNAPVATTATKLGSVLAAGCTAVLKPAEETPLDSYLLCEIAEAAGLPAGVLNVVPAGREVGAELVAHPGIDKVTFTGSVAGGRSVMASAAQHLKGITLELGGKSAAIVLPDADLDAIVPMVMTGMFVNSGQACVALSRVLIPDDRYEELAARIVEATSKLVVGDPTDPRTTIGPLTTKRQRDRVLEYIEIGKREGAKALIGGGVPASQLHGWYVEPTVFGDVDNSMRIAQEEIFGPVLCLIRYRDEAEAIAISNDSAFGLSGAVWGTDLEQGLRIARQIRTGTYSVNCRTVDSSVPFGGYKTSGVGREGGRLGLLGYLEAKSITLPVN